MSAYIEIQALNLFYGEYHALKNIDMQIKEKKVTALIGPSGCGKSTLLRTLNRMNDLIPDVKITGVVKVQGYDLYRQDVSIETLRKKIGMVFQQPNPFPKSVYDNVAFGPRIHGIRKKRELDNIVEESLRKAALWDEVKDALKKSAYSLSGGQQQRLCIARALAVEPDILLLDESTASLDPISTLKIEELVYDLKDKYTIVMVTHNLHQAARVSDETAFFLMGEMIEFDTTEVLFSKPKDPRTDDYISGRFG